MEVEQRMEWFRDRCTAAGLPCTHQRQVLYRALLEATDHPSPEALYDRVRREIPSISLGTVYRNIRTFLDRGLIGEVSLHHGSLRLEANNQPHHHFVCTECRSMFDLPVDALPVDALDPIPFRRPLPPGFRVNRFIVEAQGLCPACALKKN
ncbi:MAG: transcriptional repressor [Acidobacteria bacterium]|jgi:Fur family peroxide stress response transcriptional regulator|nr:transcriptional repressor [Acidobacteriota bacterium]